MSSPGTQNLKPKTLLLPAAACVLAETHGDKQAAARILGVSVRTLQRRFK